MKNVSAINQDGTMVVSGKRQYCREVEEVNESAKVLQNTLQEYQYKNNKSEKEASRDLNTVKRKFNSFKTYAQIKDIVGFIEAYNDEGKHWYTFQDDPKLCSAIARNQIIPDADKKDYIKFIATRILQIIDTKKLTLDNTDDRVTLEHIKKGKMVEYNYNQSGFNLSTTASELDRIIDELIDNKRCYFLYEVETQAKDEIVKCVLRTGYDLDRDISIVFAISKDGKNIVKTAWLNKKNDKHNTLDKSKYYKR